MKRVLILGGGFAGVACARTLARKLSRDEAEIALFNAQNHLVFSPLLAEVAGSAINALDVVVPLRQLLRRVICRTEEVRQLDLGGHRVIFTAEDERPSTLDYDQLVIACGNITNMNAVPGMADHAFPLKTVADAARLRSHLMQEMELAEVAATPDRRRRRLTFLVVGGGYSGVEAAGEINDLVRSSARYFRAWKPTDVRVLLIHSRDQLLPEISPGLREFARRKMEKAGVEILLNARASSATAEGVDLEDGRFLEGHTIVCTVGNSPAPLVQTLKVETINGRLSTEPDMRLKGQDNVWAIGDCAYIINAQNGQSSPTTGQYAERQGKQCAKNIIALLRNKPTRPFRFRQLGELCSIGGHSAVADLFGMHLSGFPAWFAWRGVYLFKLPTIARRLQVGFDWAWLLLFPRDLAHVRTKETDRVAHAHYRAGDFIFHSGEAPDNFYVLQHGEVELLRAQDGERMEIASVLNPGSFFGEQALLRNGSRTMSARARTDVEVLVMGRDVFTQVSDALAPFREALAQALNRRALAVYQHGPQAVELLKTEFVHDHMDGVPQPLLSPETNLRDVAAAFVEHANEFFFVSGDGNRLNGIITLTDLIRARNTGATPSTPAAEFMTANPVTIRPDETCATAVDLMSHSKLKTLPVVEDKSTRKVVGCIRARRLLGLVFQKLAERALASHTPEPSKPKSLSSATPLAGSA